MTSERLASFCFTHSTANAAPTRELTYNLLDVITGVQGGIPPFNLARNLAL